MKSPVCPTCARPCWRENHLAPPIEIETAIPEREADCTVCMHCSTIWMLEDGRCRTPTREELEAVLPVLAPVAARFAWNRFILASEPSEGSA